MSDAGGGGKVRKLPQIAAAFSATLGAFGMGAALAWTSPSQPYLDESQCGNGCDIDGISEDEFSWISSVLALSALVAGPTTGFLLNLIGRKWTMISYAVPLALGNFLFCVAYWVEDKIALYFGRVLTGFAGGAFALAAPLYIVEIASVELRGALASLMQLMVTIGIAYVNALNINEAVPWQIISVTLIAFPVALAVTMFFMPESPVYYVARHRHDDALRSLRWLRGPDADLEGELEELERDRRKTGDQDSVSIKQLFTEPMYAKPLGVVIGLMFFQQFAGINVVIFYTTTIFEQAGSDLDPGLSAFLVGLAQVIGTAVAVMVVERFGRKILLLISDFFMCISIFALGTYFYLLEHPQDFDPQTVDDLGWLPLVSLMIYVILFSIGFGPLPWALNAEIHPPESKALASALGFSFNWICAFFVTKFERDIEDALGIFGAYYMYGSVCAVGLAFVYFFVPETSGKSADELRRLFDVPPRRESVFETVMHRKSSVVSNAGEKKD